MSNYLCFQLATAVTTAACHLFVVMRHVYQVCLSTNTALLPCAFGFRHIILHCLRLMLTAYAAIILNTSLTCAILTAFMP